jgi:hypothetical protein
MTGAGSDPRDRFFPESLCHDCAAPPRYIVNSRGSIFLFCPLFKRYPPQPVRACEKFVPRPPTAGLDPAGESGPRDARPSESPQGPDEPGKKKNR